MEWTNCRFLVILRNPTCVDVMWFLLNVSLHVCQVGQPVKTVWKSSVWTMVFVQFLVFVEIAFSAGNNRWLKAFFFSFLRNFFHKFWDSSEKNNCHCIFAHPEGGTHFVLPAAILVCWRLPQRCESGTKRVLFDCYKLVKKGVPIASCLPFKFFFPTCFGRMWWVPDCSGTLRPRLPRRFGSSHWCWPGTRPHCPGWCPAAPLWWTPPAVRHTKG